MYPARSAGREDQRASQVLVRLPSPFFRSRFSNSRRLRHRNQLCWHMPFWPGVGALPHKVLAASFSRDRRGNVHKMHRIVRTTESNQCACGQPCLIERRRMSWTQVDRTCGHKECPHQGPLGGLMMMQLTWSVT